MPGRDRSCRSRENQESGSPAGDFRAPSARRGGHRRSGAPRRPRGRARRRRQSRRAPFRERLLPSRRTRRKGWHSCREGWAAARYSAAAISRIADWSHRRRASTVVRFGDAGIAGGNSSRSGKDHRRSRRAPRSARLPRRAAPGAQVAPGGRHERGGIGRIRWTTTNTKRRWPRLRHSPRCRSVSPTA